MSIYIAHRHRMHGPIASNCAHVHMSVSHAFTTSKPPNCYNTSWTGYRSVNFKHIAWDYTRVMEALKCQVGLCVELNPQILLCM